MCTYNQLPLSDGLVTVEIIVWHFIFFGLQQCYIIRITSPTEWGLRQRHTKGLLKIQLRLDTLAKGRKYHLKLLKLKLKDSGH